MFYAKVSGTMTAKLTIQDYKWLIIKLLKSLRKATGLGIADCQKVINKYNDLGLAINMH